MLMRILVHHLKNSMSKLLYYDLPRLNHFQKEWLKSNGYNFVRVEMDESDKFWWETYGIKEEEND